MYSELGVGWCSYDASTLFRNFSAENKQPDLESLLPTWSVSSDDGLIPPDYQQNMFFTNNDIVIWTQVFRIRIQYSLVLPIFHKLQGICMQFMQTCLLLYSLSHICHSLIVGLFISVDLFLKLYCGIAWRFNSHL